MKSYYVYIMASKKNGTIYIGITNNLEVRVFQHKNKLFKGFTEKYNVNKLVYYEETNDVLTALNREKELKGKTRIKKIELIEKNNPEWNDLSLNWNN